MKTGDVTSLVYNYTVRLDKATIADLNLAVAVDNISNPLVSVVANPTSTTINKDGVTLTTVVVTVTLNDPADLAAYTAIANSTVTFDITFTASIAS